MGNLTLQENVKKNEEYFENLQKCYNPSQVEPRDGLKLGRSHSSEGLRNRNDISKEQKIKEFLGGWKLSKTFQI